MTTEKNVPYIEKLVVKNRTKTTSKTITMLSQCFLIDPARVNGTIGDGSYRLDIAIRKWQTKKAGDGWEGPFEVTTETYREVEGGVKDYSVSVPPHEPPPPPPPMISIWNGQENTHIEGDEAVALMNELEITDD